MKLRAPLFVAAFLAIAATASAQYRGGTVEIEGFGGYLFGGGLGHFHDFSQNNCCFDSHLSVDNDAYYGGRIGYNFTNFWEVETEFAQSKTHLEIESHDHHNDIPDIRVGDLRFDYYMAYMTMNFGHTSRFVPYFTLGTGAGDVHHDIPGGINNGSEAHFTLGAGGGIKIFVSPHFAFRFDTRSYSTHLSDHDICGPTFCSAATWVTNVVANGGFIIAF
jgi:opacity protein-like surface antigen